MTHVTILEVTCVTSLRNQSFLFLYSNDMNVEKYNCKNGDCDVLELCQVTVVEISRPSPSLPEILSGVGNSLTGVDRTLKELLQGLTFSDGVQARMDGIMFQRLEGYPSANPILSIIKDYLSSL